MRKFFEIKNLIPGKKAEIRIHGNIVDSKWDDMDPDVTPADFAAELDGIKAYEEIDIYINSPGGNVFAGLAMYHMLKRHPAQKTVYNDGVIASIASVIAMAGDKIVMPKTSMMLIHKALVIGAGNADDFLSLAAELDRVDGIIAEAYASRMGTPIDEIKKIMAEDRFLDAQEAFELGLVDEIAGEKEISASIRGNILNVNGQNVDISRFKNFPKDRFKAVKKPAPVVNEPVLPVIEPAPAVNEPENTYHILAETLYNHSSTILQEVVV